MQGNSNSLADLRDVAFTSLTNGQVQTYDSASGKWKNSDPGALDLSGYALLAGRAAGQTLSGGTDGTQGLVLRGTSDATATTTVTTEAGTAIWRTGANKAGLAERMRLSSVGRLGIGSSNPQAMIDIVSTDAFGGITNTIFSDTYPGWYTMVRHRGTPSAPTDVASGDAVGELRYYAYASVSGGSAGTGRIQNLISGAPASGGIPADFVFSLGSATGITERMRLTSSGYLGLGTNSPGWPLHILNPGGVGTILDAYGTPPQSSIYYRGARGSVASPATVVANDIIAQYVWAGHDGTAFRTGVNLSAYVYGAPTTSGCPMLLTFQLNDGTSTKQALRLLPTQNAVLYGNAAPPTAQVANGAFCLWLDQTAGATKLMVYAKDSAGTVRTTSIALA